MDLINLAGLWLCAMGGPAPTYPQATLPPVTYTATIELPGTTETRGLGPLNTAAETDMLTRIRRFEGPVWYARDVDVPASWAGRELQLFLERTKYVQVWWDDRPVGEQGWYLTPSILTLPSAQPGHHRITVQVDNRPERRPVQADAHQFSDNTQTNWNGILGRIELRALAPAAITHVRADPVLAGTTADPTGHVAAAAPDAAFALTVQVDPHRSAPAGGELTISAESFNHPGAPQVIGPVTVPVSFAAGTGMIRAQLPLGAHPLLWSEGSPALYRITVRLHTAAGDDERVIETGLREWGHRGAQFTVNGKVVFLRGKHDACVFPLTGHPPMDLDGWLTYLRTCQAWGINAIRCHTWVPPEAAFAAADRLGMYLQPELPFWGNFDENVRAWLQPEADRVLENLGNHPSFLMMTMGNELWSGRPVLRALVEHLQSLDRRHAYSEGSNALLGDPRIQPSDDFMVTAKLIPTGADKALPIRGSFASLDDPNRTDSAVLWGRGDTAYDYRAALRGAEVPVISHEIGQYTVFPDFREISDYTGVTRARNLAHWRDVLTAHGMADQAEAFHLASGRLAASLYREDIEAALRTPGFAGYQLLDIQDFPGQGTALVGILDAFMRSKGVIDRADWRRFVSPTVPLVRLPRRTWFGGDAFDVALELAHFGPNDLHDIKTTWSLRDGAQVLATGDAPAASRLAAGQLSELGQVHVLLPTPSAGERLEFALRVASAEGTWEQTWPIWVYPRHRGLDLPPGVKLFRRLDADAQQALAAGERVVVMADEHPWMGSLPGGYATDFWNWKMFSNPPGTMGLLIDARHPAFAGFPTQSYTERQWTNIVLPARPALLTDLPVALHPFAQVIDNYVRNERLGLLFEARVGKGRLLVCASDLLAHRDDPAVAQLLASLWAYVASDRFQPRESVEATALQRVLMPAAVDSIGITVSSSVKSWNRTIRAEAIVDHDANTRWEAAADDANPTITLDLHGAHRIASMLIQWEDDEPGYRYTVDATTDGTHWTPLITEGGTHEATGRHWLTFPAMTAQQVRLKISSTPGGKPAGIREIEIGG